MFLTKRDRTNHRPDFRIAKRSVWKRFNSGRIFSGFSALLFLVGSAFMWYAGVVEAGVTQFPGLSSARQISSGEVSTCAIGFDGRAYCWGRNDYGQLGNNSTTNSSLPVAVDTSGVLDGKTILSISAGGSHTCAIASDNQAYCWGYNQYGQLGNNQSTGTSSQFNSLVPSAVNTTGVLDGKTILSISAGGNHTCAIASDNQAYCWGYNQYGQLGNNKSTGTSSQFNSLVPSAVDATGVLSGKTILSISAGYQYTCAIASDNQAYCWGSNYNGQLGNNSTTQSTVPVAVNTTGVLSGKTILSISAGANHTCAVASDNQAYCWGYNNYGQLGNNSTTQSAVPVAVDTTGVLSGKTILSISAGQNHTCAVASDNQAYCWGWNQYGQLGNNKSTGTSPYFNSLVPSAVDNTGVLAGKTILSIAAGSNHTCAIASDNQAYCWGRNYNGPLGSSEIDTAYYAIPAVVANAYIPGPRIYAGDNSFKLQFAQRTAAMCSLQTTGFADVTASSAVAYNDNPSVTNGAAISSTANDPVASADATPQTYQEATGSFTNANTIEPGKTGLWDFSLKVTDLTPNRSYCMRIVYGDGSAVEAAMSYPEITRDTAKLNIGFVDGAGNAVANPDFNFTNRSMTSITSQTSTAAFGTASAKLRVFNTQATNGWSVSLAPTDGPTATWNRSDSLAKYDFNDNGANAADSGADADLLGGQLSVNASAGAVASSCSLTGLSVGSNSKFVEGTTNSITLFTASSASAMNCFWDYTGASLSQTIPKAQPAGSYSINMTATVVAQ